MDEKYVDGSMMHKGENPKRKKKYYAVLRGRYDEHEDEFVSGIFDDFEEYNDAVMGATGFKAKGHDTYEKAAKWYEDHIESIEAENASYRNQDGQYSPQWYAVWCVETGDFHTVATDAESERFVLGSATYKRFKYTNHVDALERCKKEHMAWQNRRKEQSV